MPKTRAETRENASLCDPLRSPTEEAAVLKTRSETRSPALGGSGLPPPGLAPLAPRLLAGSRGTAVRVTTLPFPMPTQAAPRVPLPC